MTEYTQEAAKRPLAPFRSAGAASHSPEEISQEVSALLRATDTLQQVRNESDQLVRMALDDSELLAMAREIAQSQGEALDEARLEEALAQVKDQRFRFQAPPHAGFGAKIAQAWVTRDQWGPRWRIGALTVFLTGLALGSTMFVVGQVGQARWVSEMEETLASEAALEQSLQANLKRATLDPNAPAAVANQVSLARGALAASTSERSGLPGAPATSDALEALYEQDKDAARELLEKRQAILGKAHALGQQAVAALGQADALRIAYGEAGQFDQPIPEALAGLRDRQRVAFQAAAQRGDAQGMQQAVQTLGQAVGLIKVRDAMATQTGLLSEKSRETIGQQLDSATVAIAAGEIDRGQEMLNTTQNLLSQASVGYRLQVVSEAGVQSGVWRYYDNNRNAKAYYIVVDAIAPDGSKVSLPITSVEDKTTKTTHRFALRVPEATYNRIASDKQEDGIVDNDLMGEKAVGELEPTYAFPVEGGAITNW